jgi:ribosomal protein S18 acetylase RimI-like enzyme
MHINQLNIENLTSLWKKYGASATKYGEYSIYKSDSWPYRSWAEDENKGNAEGKRETADGHEADPKLALQLSSTPASHLLTIWAFEKDSNKQAQRIANNKWQLAFELTAMCRPLSKATLPEIRNSNLTLRRVTDNETLKTWLEISSEAFNYEIDAAVFQTLLNDQDIEIYLGEVDNKPAVSALLLKTGKVTGLHQMGVKSTFQGQGLGKKAMHLLIHRAAQQGSDYMMLQASEMGLPLYKSVGFDSLFTLSHYKKAHE